MRTLLLIFPFCLTALSQNDARVQALYSEAKKAQAHKDLPAAIALYEDILKVAPNLAAAYNNLGTLYFQQREYAKAVAVLERGLNIDASMSSASALLGISFYQMGEYGKARPYLEAAIKANPKDRNAQMFLARDLAKGEDWEAAATQLRKLTSSDPKNQEAWYLLAKLHMRLSERALARMNEIDPNSALAHQLSADVMESMNNYDGAVVELKKAVELAPNAEGNHYRLGDAYWNLSQWDAAAAQFQAELALDPGNCFARWKAGNVVLQKNEEAAAALAELDRAVVQCPTLTDAKVDRARALIALQRHKEAASDLEAALQESPGEASIHFLLAKTYRSLGRGEDAQAEMRIFSRLDEAARSAVAQHAQEVIQNKEGIH